MTAAVLPIPADPRLRLPAPARIALLLFLVLLPLHNLVMAALFGFAGLPAFTVRAMASWKEIAVFGLFAWIVVRSLTGRGPRMAFAGADVAVTALIMIAVLFALTENIWFRAGIPAGAQLYGLRDVVLYLLLYYVGRGMPELADDPGLLRRLFLLALVVSSIAVIEWLFVTPEMLVLLGVAAYFNDFLGVTAFTAGVDLGLPHNYWSLIGGLAVQRAGSVFLSAQAFAIPFLLLMPAATAYALTRRHRHGALVRIGYGIIWAGLLLSITRMTILICVLQVLFWFVLLKRPEWAVGTVIMACVVFAASVLVLPGLLVFVWQTLTWQTGSNITHAQDWAKGLAAFAEQSWGHGLGTTDLVAVRFGLEPVTADNLFIKYAVEMGVLGVAALVAILAAFLRIGWRVYRHATSDNHQRLGVVLALTTLGIVLNGITGAVFNSLLLSYLYFWFAGVLVSVAQRQSVAEVRGTRASMELRP